MTATERAGPVRPFDIAAELPAEGLCVIEASAGTGKTFALTSLVVRFVASGHPLSEILAVTFTRLATGELRDRVRTRLLEAVACLDGVGSGTAPTADALMQWLADGSASEVAERRRRLSDAVSDFDAATIATTHGFCQLVLDGLGTAGDTSSSTRLLEDPSDLVREAVDDLYTSWYLKPRPDLGFGPEVARRATAVAVANPGTPVVPVAGGSRGRLLARLVERARGEVERRLLDEGAITYDQLLHRLATTLGDPSRGPAARRRLAERYRVVLVDEFQDTDPLQWAILQQAFGRGDCRLILIGDPKQAIYAFRGADVHSYLDAVARAGTHLTLAGNWRSDQPLLDALDALMSPLQFGHPDIPFRSVAAAPGRQTSGLCDAPSGVPLRVRVLDDRQPGVGITPSKGLMQKPALVDWIARDVAADIETLLAAKAGVDGGGSGRPTRLSPADVAVLTRTNRQAVIVKDALRRRGVASVVAGLDTVFASEAAVAWLRLLDAVQEPSSRSRVAALALSPFVGLGPSELAVCDEEGWDVLHDRALAWSSVLGSSGVAALLRHVTRTERLPERILAVAGGERLLTDIEHVGQLLHVAASAGSLGATSLRAWLAARIRQVGEDQADTDERTRRLESDSDAVQVLTIHRAKGLEFSVVYCPYLWDAGVTEPSGAPVIYHDPDRAFGRHLDVGSPDRDGPSQREYLAHAAVARAERRGEDLRLLYVALTRARHQCVLWWARASDSRHSPLGRLLLCRDPSTGTVGDAPPGEPRSAQIRRALDAVASRAPGMVAVEEPGFPEEAKRTAGDAPGEPALLVAAVFGRRFDQAWRRSSYTSISSGAQGTVGGGRPPGALSEPEAAGLEDEPAEPESEAEPSSAPGSPPTSVPAGAETGTYVHVVLEKVDFAAADLRAEVASVTASLPAPPKLAAPEVQGSLITLICRAVGTPLGPLVDNVPLASIARTDRLDELSFEMPVAGGDRPEGSLLLADVAALLERHLDGSFLAGYPQRLLDPGITPVLRGYLTGSIDLVFRRGDSAGRTRWFVVDYKTNRLEPFGADPSEAHYSAAALDMEMQRHHYPLQALIYSVALHRYLRWRLPGYQPADHLGGVLYLFLRGMSGPGTGPSTGLSSDPVGVLAWRPPATLVTGLSDLFEGRIP